MTFTVSLDFSSLERFASEASDRLENDVPQQIVAILRDDAKHQFAVGGEPRWEPLSPSTIRHKRAAGYPRLNRKGLIPASSIQNGQFGPAKVLMMTMALYSSWTNPQDPHHFEEVSASGVSIGSTLIYAATHQYGDTRPAWHGRTVTIPARPIVVTDRAAKQIADLISTSL